MGLVMKNPLVCHVGKLSYSIFLLHDFTELLVPKTAFLRPILESDFRAVILIPLTILLAHFAWQWIEAPMLSFRKKHLPAPAVPDTV